MIEHALLDSLWQGAFVVALAAIVSGLLTQRNAATRYAVWFAALLTVAILPALSSWHPQATIAVIPSPVAHTASFASSVTAQTATAGRSWLAIVWLIGVGWCLSRLALSYLRIVWIIRRAHPAPEFGAGVLASRDVTVPIAAGLLRPAVVIPAGLIETLDRLELASIVEHERAHIRRLDILGNFVQRAIEAVLFFNPWVYVIGAQLVKEREAACDDWVVAATSDAAGYASCLSRLAQGSGRSKDLLFTPSAIGSRHMLLGRIARLLNGKAGQLKVNYVALGASVVGFALLGMVLQTPQGRAATASCTFPQGYADVKVLNAAMPDIPKSAHSGLSAGALVTVDANGKPVSAKIVKPSGNAEVDRATVNAAMASAYSPEMKHCTAVAGGMYLFHVETGP
jgi:bla regulator protein blaR1